MDHALQGLVQGVDHAGLGQHVQGPTGPLDGFFLAQHIGPTRAHQHQVVKAHDPHGPGRGAHIASVAGLDQDESGLHAPIVPPRPAPADELAAKWPVL